MDESAADSFKKPINKKKRGKKQSLQTRKSCNQKWYNNCLPHAISECTWVDNTDFNIKLLDEKNKKIKTEREKRRSESKANEIEQIEKMLEQERMQEKYIQLLKNEEKQDKDLIETV